MANRNLYLKYKKDTSDLLFWIINTSNNIIRANKNTEHGLTINTTGTSTVAGIVAMSDLIAQNTNRTPRRILRLFKAVIDARSTMHAFFQRIANHHPDPGIIRSNSMHKHFIDALREAFSNLHGNSIRDDKGFWSTTEPIKEPTLQDQFSTLNVDDARDYNSSASDDIDSPKQSGPPPKTKRRKKGKNGNRRRKDTSNNVQDRALADVPLESYRFDQDQDASEYLLAASSVVHEWIELRSYTQDLWREVAYDGLNGAVAATLSFSAVAMVKQTCSAVFVDFPGLEYYHKIVQAVVGMETGTLQVDRILEQTQPLTNIPGMKSEENGLDAKEHLWVHAYNDLVTFIEDFRKNRTGKPTKALQTVLNNWNPDLDLQRCSDEERLQWRRTYTIIWLYDLVNVFKAPVLIESVLNGEEPVYEDIDWSPNGSWKNARRLFGLNEFAGVITGLCFARQIKGTHVRNRILPHHVFQLQCIVDSFTVSRGWYLSTDQGHILTSPPPDFRPPRDLEPFLGRDPELHAQGVLPALRAVIDYCCGPVDEEDPDYIKRTDSAVTRLEFEFEIHLGRTRMYERNASGVTVLSLFTKFNPVGWWEYSPFLCAAGLVEALVLVQRIGMSGWNSRPEHELSMQLHRILLRTGYLHEGVRLWSKMDLLFKDSFFRCEDMRFSRGWWNTDSEILRQRRIMRHGERRDAHAVFSSKLNQYCRVESVLTTYYDADWIPDRIPDKDVKIPSVMAKIRLKAAQRADQATNDRKQVQESELMKRARSCPEMCKFLFEAAGASSPKAISRTAKSPEISNNHVKHPLTTIASLIPRRNPYRVSRQEMNEEPQGRALLELLRADIFNDICGQTPLSGLNYILTTTIVLELFDDFESRCTETRLPLWVRFNECEIARTPLKREAFLLEILVTMDHGALRLLAKSFEHVRPKAETVTYWETLA